MPLYDLWGHSDLEIEIPKEEFPDDEWLKDKDDLFDYPEHGFFTSCYQGKKIHYRKNIPKGDVKAIVVWHHGICGQSGFGMKCAHGFTDMALRIRKMNERGIAVYSHDSLGHGFSEGCRFYIPEGNWKLNRDDLVDFCKMAAEDYPDSPLFVTGDSYGGCLALHAAYALQESKAIPGFVGCSLNCPVIEGDLPSLPVIWFLRYGLAPFFPKWTPFFMPHPITSERIWKVKEARDYFSNSKEMHGLSRGGVPFCLGTAVGLLSALQEAQQISHEIQLPFHISHGDTDYGVPLSGSQHLMKYSKTPSNQKVLNVIEDGYHGMFSQPDAEEILDHEIAWIQSMLQANM
uniref:Serine aminopeptidase S33 domain-containing protein n=1 Tax=Odontella aurita TaxID=265563 RepID=A0A7S4NHY2_9STRA|mmetsp:Transcript_7222/g.21428  ORF Transcript_7222/g.21428 Transcript_7222/m.21428 type:complete len:345 (+) Transcript_7222:197-1231(+)